VGCLENTSVCLGPCFSGCLVGTGYILEGEVGENMSLCLGPCFSGCLVGTTWFSSQETRWVMMCLGPCFSGCLVGTTSHRRTRITAIIGLGPCFSGCLVGTLGDRGEEDEKIGDFNVSVLVLVDVWWVQKEKIGDFNLCLGPCFSGCLVGTPCQKS